MPSLRTPSPLRLVTKPMSSGREQHQLDPNGEITLLMTRFVQYVDDSSDCQTPKDSGGTKASSHGEEEISIRVSSRHLILASSVFRAMLEHRFGESQTLHTVGSVEIPLPEDDPDAFLILLKIIHGHLRQVPLQVDLQTLTQLAILVDKYELHERIEVFTGFWFGNLISTIPNCYTDDIPSWTCVCWVFNKPEEFKRVTRLILRHGRGTLTFKELPVPSFVADAINSRREEAIRRIISSLIGHLDDYLENEHCSFECDALMVGALTKRLRAFNILPHRPKSPYTGLSLQDFTHRFRHGMYFPAAQRTSTFFYSHSKCAIPSIDRMLAECEQLSDGLDMADYKTALTLAL
ncbi:BTB domain-containing protein [Trichophyton interdigitale]|uniref:BTB domain-containing protein n=1 Tax=Trichophyton interdigitale TaxID=101480 RepID=A0A9P5CXB3_9EURO|nr:BTB domain-containing protein [Trichophyton interdigitale]KAF3894933.1 BTB domain-containing protein [Trichophyton interdigitale]KAG8209535.1 BTB domain-containing protein [Trichophyton interdigitale]